MLKNSEFVSSENMCSFLKSGIERMVYIFIYITKKNKNIS